VIEMHMTDAEKVRAVAQHQHTILQAEMRSLAQEMGEDANDPNFKPNGLPRQSKSTFVGYHFPVFANQD
jgi:hypothetical protein